MDGHAGNNLQFFSSFAQAKQIRLGEPPSALLRSNRYDIGSPLFSVELELGQAELPEAGMPNAVPGDEVVKLPAARGLGHEVQKRVFALA